MYSWSRFSCSLSIPLHSIPSCPVPFLLFCSVLFHSMPSHCLPFHVCTHIRAHPTLHITEVFILKSSTPGKSLLAPPHCDFTPLSTLTCACSLPRQSLSGHYGVPQNFLFIVLFLLFYPLLSHFNRFFCGGFPLFGQGMEWNGTGQNRTEWKWRKRESQSFCLYFVSETAAL
jgi:hypothetical protein